MLNTVFLFCVILSFIILNQCNKLILEIKFVRLKNIISVQVLNGSYAGLAISQTATLAGTLQFGIGQIVHVVSQLTSVERILEFSDTAIEKSFPLVSSK